MLPYITSIIQCPVLNS